MHSVSSAAAAGKSIFNAIWCLLAIIRQSKRFCGVMVHFIVLYSALFSNIIRRVCRQSEQKAPQACVIKSDHAEHVR